MRCHFLRSLRGRSLLHGFSNSGQAPTFISPTISINFAPHLQRHKLPGSGRAGGQTARQGHFQAPLAARWRARFIGPSSEPELGPLGEWVKFLAALLSAVGQPKLAPLASLFSRSNQHENSVLAHKQPEASGPKRGNSLSSAASRACRRRGARATQWPSCRCSV